MSGAGRVPFVGLTGGIGSGKSTALAELAELGAATLSADAVVHELLGGAEVRDAIVARLGAEALAADGTVDRAAVAALVFSRADDRAWLEGLLWPGVAARIAEWREAVDGLEPQPVAAVVEVPLLFEAGMDTVFDATVAIVAEESLRAERAAARGHAAVEERSRRQWTQGDKAARADHVVRNDGGRGDLRRALGGVLAEIGSP